jgi:hypothetical protein
MKRDYSLAAILVPGGLSATRQLLRNQHRIDADCIDLGGHPSVGLQANGCHSYFCVVCEICICVFPFLSISVMEMTSWSLFFMDKIDVPPKSIDVA